MNTFCFNCHGIQKSFFFAFNGIIWWKTQSEAFFFKIDNNSMFRPSQFKAGIISIKTFNWFITKRNEWKRKWKMLSWFQSISFSLIHLLRLCLLYPFNLFYISHISHEKHGSENSSFNFIFNRCVFIVFIVGAYKGVQQKLELDDETELFVSARIIWRF